MAKQEIVFTGRLTLARLKELAQTHGINPLTDLPEGTIFNGPVTVDILKDLCHKHLELKSESDKYNPALNHDVISIIKQEDGHWKGYWFKRGNLIETREVAPEHALQQLLVS